MRDRLKGLKSLRVQSLCVLILTGILPLIIFTLILLGTYRSRAVSQQIAELQTRGSILCNLVVSSAFLSNDLTSEVDSELTQISDIYNGRILIVDSGLVVVRDTYGLEENRTILIKEVLQCIRGDEVRVVREGKEDVQIVLPVYYTEKDTADGAVIMNFSLSSVNRMYRTVETISLTMILLLGVIVIVSSVLYSGQVIQPLREMDASIATITQGDRGGTMDLHGFVEVEKISQDFNLMLGDLQNLEEARQEFVSNVSHELKTPLTSVTVLAESLISQEEAPVELYREFLTDILDELDRMNKIINDLLSLVKMDKNASDVNVSEVNINEFVESILKQLQPIADQRNISIIFESVRPVTAQIDEVKLGMAFRNLIENAVKYNYDDGWVRVSLNADHKFFYLKVEDSGVGIPEELQDNIFERFYRVDKARSRETGGNGLGLAITRSAILLHRGSIKVHSVEQQGTTFTVRIPLIFLE